MSEQGRIGVTGPEVIETNKGVEEFDSKDKGLVWSTVGGRNRRLIGGADVYATDTFAGFRAAIGEALKRVPAFSLATLRAENARLAERLKRFGSCDAAADMWAALGIPDPAKLQDMPDDAFMAIAEDKGDSRHDAR